MAAPSGVVGELTRRWQNLGPVGRLLVAGLAAALAAAVVLVALVQRPGFVVLATGLDPRDTGEVVRRLAELQVPYRFGSDGNSILVPSGEFAPARLALAQAGVPGSGGDGWELFDQTRLGATEFDRRVNFLRALQGELARAVMRLQQVEYANVKLVLPERSVFVRDQRAQTATAAVLLQTRPGYELTPAEVRGIVLFISRAVEGLLPENVTVVDSFGRVLAADLGEQGPAVSAEQMRLQLQQQQEKERQVQSLLEPVFGVGDVVARVHVTLDFDRSTVESHTYLPVEGGQGLVRSQETLRESFSGQGGAAIGVPGMDANMPPLYQAPAGEGGSSEAERSHNVVNYELPERREFFERAPGRVERVTVAVMINRPELEIAQTQQIRETVAAATGAALGDISVTAFAFNRDLVDALQGEPETAAAAQPQFWQRPATWAAAAAAVVAIFFVLRRRREETAPVAADPLELLAARKEGDESGRELPSPDPARNRLHEHAEGMARQKPESVAALVKAWLAED